MDAQQTTFLFGRLLPGADLDDVDSRDELLAVGYSDVPALQLAAVQAIATQIADHDPPEVWQNVQRLLADGHDPENVLNEVALTFRPYALAAWTSSHKPDGQQRYDQQEYVQALGRLPLPSIGACQVALVAAAVTRPVSTIVQLIEGAAHRLGLNPDGRGIDSGVVVLMEAMLETLLGEASVLAMLSGERIVHVQMMTDGIVLTHRVLAAESLAGELTDEVDLAGFRGEDELFLPEPHAPEGTLVAVRVDDDEVSIEVLTKAPAVTKTLVARLRACYDEAIAEIPLPVAVEELILASILADLRSFSKPAAPLRQLLAAAGLEVRGDRVAHDASIWRAAARTDGIGRLAEEFGPDEPLGTILRVLGALDGAELGDGELEDAAAHVVLDELADPVVLLAITGLLLGRDGDPDQAAETGRVGARLLVAARKPGQKARARWLLAVGAEQDGRLEEAEAHLAEAVRLDPDGAVWADRLAWYRFDRGDADGARSLWRALGLTSDDSDDLLELDDLPATAPVTLGRNEPCWCGSGRKFKQCHLGRPEPLPLPDRVEWLCRKAAGFLDRHRGDAGEVMITHLLARAADPNDPDSLLAALSDPLTVGVVQHESGWFGRFLDARGALLPEDELLLGRVWEKVPRSVYEVIDVRKGTSLSVRDLRTGHLVEIRDRSYSKVARPGGVVCARAVPDGKTNQFIGGVFGIEPGTERPLLEVLDTGDGLALLAYQADLRRPEES